MITDRSVASYPAPRAPAVRASCHHFFFSVEFLFRCVWCTGTDLPGYARQDYRDRRELSNILAIIRPICSVVALTMFSGTMAEAVSTRACPQGVVATMPACTSLRCTRPYMSMHMSIHMRRHATGTFDEIAWSVWWQKSSYSPCRGVYSYGPRDRNPRAHPAVAYIVMAVTEILATHPAAAHIVMALVTKILELTLP